MGNDSWQIYRKNKEKDGIQDVDWSKFPPPPSWRSFNQENDFEERKDDSKWEGQDNHRGKTFQPTEDVIDMVNAALYLRRPLLVTGKPGTGKSSLAYAVAYQLMLGEVLYWPITTRTTLKQGLYDYDAIGRLQDAKVGFAEDQRDINEALSKEDLKRAELKGIGSYITLGPLGTALIPSEKPRVLLIDEIDKSDIDLPNDLLTVLEEGRFDIPELVRIKEILPSVKVRTAYRQPPKNDKYVQNEKCEVIGGRVTCTEFPFIVLTSNGERAFPPAFLRRCLRLNMPDPTEMQLKGIVEAHLKADLEARKQRVAGDKEKQAVENQYKQTVETLISSFLKRRENGGDISTDQLLNAIFMLTREYPIAGDEKKELEQKLNKLAEEQLMKPLTSSEDG